MSKSNKMTPPREKYSPHLIDVAGAWRKIIKEIPPPTPEILPIAKTLARVVAKDLKSPCDSPLFSCSAMDGFAVRSVDISCALPKKPIRLKVIDTISAGRKPSKRIRSGEAARIFTGAPVPAGADCVVIQEHADLEGDEVVIKQPAGKGDNIRKRGEEIKKGAIIIRRGSLVNPPMMGLLASLGLKRIAVYKKPRIAFFTTGNELVDYRRKSPSGKIRDSHSLMLPSSLLDLGLEVKVLKRCPDKLAQIKLRIKRSLALSDVLIISGGVSVGEYDLVKDALLDNKVKPIFWRVSMKPGKPLFFGKRGKKLVFGLPGNPAAALVALYMFVRPTLTRMSGLKNYEPVTLCAKLSSSYAKKSKRTQFLKGKIVITQRGEIRVEILRGQESHMLKSFSEADCLVIIPPTREKYKKGDTVTIKPLPWVFK